MSKIVFVCGIDGCGKSTLLKNAQMSLTKDCHSTTVVPMVGSSPVSQLVRTQVLSGALQVSKASEMNLMYTAIIETLESIETSGRDFILVDRYISAFYTYQGLVPQFGFSTLYKQLEDTILHYLRNHEVLYVYLDTEETLARSRMSERTLDRNDKLSPIVRNALLDRYRQHYHDYNLTAKCLLDGDRGKEYVLTDFLQLIKDFK